MEITEKYCVPVDPESFFSIKLQLQNYFIYFKDAFFEGDIVRIQEAVSGKLTGRYVDVTILNIVAACEYSSCYSIELL